MLLRTLGLFSALALVTGFFVPTPLLAAGDSGQRDPRIEKILSQISEQRLTGILQKLGSFGTRNTLSSTDSPTKGIGAAREWIFDEMKKSSSRLQVSFDSYLVPKGGRITRDIELRNVMAVLPGKSARRVYVSGHYDSFAAVRSANAGAQRPAGGGAAAGGVGTAAGTGAGAAAGAAAAQGAAGAGAVAAQAGGAGRPTGAGQRGAAQAANAGQPGVGQGSAAGAPSVDAPSVDAPPVDNPAPGVNDDGSGTALVMELARVFADSGIEFDATLVFIALAGEEQGLIGATRHAEKAVADKLVIDAVLNNDMVGNVQAGDGLQDSVHVRAFSEGPEDSPSRQLARYISRAAARYVPTQQVTLVARYDRFGRGGDHTAFNQKGFTAVRLTEALESFERQHTTADTFEGMNIPYFLRNVRLNAATMASLALAPPAPGVASERGQPTLGRQPSGYDANLKWKASAGALSYKVYWREAWTPDWQHELNVGNVTEFVLPSLSIDNYVFGVAAVGADDNESLVSVYVNPPRR